MKLLTCLALMACLATALAQTSTWQAPLAPNCTAVPLPSSSWGTTGAADLGTAIALSTGGLPAVVLCPGIAYDLNVKFPTARRCVVAVSQGNLSQPTSTACPNRVISATGTTLVTRQLTLACSATGYVYIDVASVDASLTKSSQYKQMKLPYAISPLAACLTSPCAKTFTLKTFTDALATAQSFLKALESLGDTWGNGLQNVGSDIVNSLVAPLGLSDELQALTGALETIGNTFNTGTGTIANPAQFLSAFKQLSVLVGGDTSSGLSGLLHALTTVGTAVTATTAGSSTASSGTQSLPNLLAALQTVGKLLNPTATSAAVSLQSLMSSGQSVLTTMVALFPQAGATASVSAVNLAALINFAQAVGGLFGQLGALGVAVSG